MVSKKINLKEKFSKFNKHWSPRVIAEMNNYQFKIAKISFKFSEYFPIILNIALLLPVTI